MLFAGDVRYWVYLLGAVVLLALCVWAMWWGLFADRARGRRRCPACWYDMSKTPGFTCSECGHEGADETDLHRTRRRWTLVVLAAIAASLGSSVQLHHILDEGWTSIMPTRVLIACIPWTRDADGELATELFVRDNQGLVSPEQWTLVIDRALRGDAGARPGSVPWRRKYAPYLQRRPAGLPAEFDERQWALPPVLVARAADPGDAAGDGRAWLRVDCATYWPGAADCRLIVTGPDDQVVVRALRHADGRGGPLGVSIDGGLIPDDVDEVTWTIATERRAIEGAGSLAWEAVDEREVAVAIARHDDLKPMEPSPEVAAAIESAFDAGVVVWKTGEIPVQFRFDMSETETTEFFRASVGVRMQLRYDDQIARELALWWPGGRQPGRAPYGFEVRYEDVPLLRTFEPGAPGWTLVVIGDPAIAARVSDDPAPLRYWAGEIEIPITPVRTRVNQTSAGRPRWTIESVASAEDAE